MRELPRSNRPRRSFPQVLEAVPVEIEGPRQSAAAERELAGQLDDRNVSIVADDGWHRDDRCIPRSAYGQIGASPSQAQIDPNTARSSPSTH